MTSIIPFLPFSKDEQAIVAHKFLLQLRKAVRAPVSLPENIVGNVNLHIRRETAVCIALAKGGYYSDTGARSLESEVTRKVKNPLVQIYLDGNSAVNENQPTEDYILDIDRHGNIQLSKGT